MTVHLGTCGIASNAAPRRWGTKGIWFECPTVQHIRDYHSDLFWDGQSMREFVNQTDQAAVMDFIVACFQCGQINSLGVFVIN